MADRNDNGSRVLGWPQRSQASVVTDGNVDRGALFSAVPVAQRQPLMAQDAMAEHVRTVQKMIDSFALHTQSVILASRIAATHTVTSAAFSVVLVVLTGALFRHRHGSFNR